MKFAAALCAPVLALAACAAPACKAIVIRTPPEIIERTVVVHDGGGPTPHRTLINLYADTVPKQEALIHSAPASTINQLTAANAAARRALEPLKRRGHIATPAEVKQAVVSVGTVAAIVSEPHPPAPPVPKLLPPLKPLPKIRATTGH